MPFDRKEYMKEYRKKYREKNNEKLKESYKQYYQKNKEKLKENQKEYQKKNREKIKEYNQTLSRIKSNKISKWKGYGVIHPNFDELYEKYIQTEFCELCNIKLTVDKRNTPTTRCLDHNHETGEFRNVLCHICNVKRG